MSEITDRAALIAARIEELFQMSHRELATALARAEQKLSEHAAVIEKVLALTGDIGPEARRILSGALPSAATESREPDHD